jgi:5'-methylthioadenosine phosphorylase
MDLERIKTAPVNSKKAVGVIGGSGLYGLNGLKNVRELRVNTPFGSPSDAFVLGELEDIELVFLPRHGKGHRVLPTELNSRANIWGMKKLGVEWLISVSAVGSLKASIRPGEVVIPDQFIDRTVHRASTFFGSGLVAHVSLADPFCPGLARSLVRAGRRARASIHPRGTYLCMEGPQFSTRAESNLYRKWGADVIGMTNLQEAKLCREAEICFGTIALCTDYDCWKRDQAQVSIDEVIKMIQKNTLLAQTILRFLAKDLPQRSCGCGSALKNALVTQKNLIPASVRRNLSLLIGKYLVD